MVRKVKVQSQFKATAAEGSIYTNPFASEKADAGKAQTAHADYVSVRRG